MILLESIILSDFWLQNVVCKILLRHRKISFDFAHFALFDENALNVFTSKVLLALATEVGLGLSADFGLLDATLPWNLFLEANKYLEEYLFLQLCLQKIRQILLQIYD